MIGSRGAIPLLAHSLKYSVLYVFIYFNTSLVPVIILILLIKNINYSEDKIITFY